MKYFLLACLLGLSSYAFAQTAAQTPTQAQGQTTSPEVVNPPIYNMVVIPTLAGSHVTDTYPTLTPKQKDSVAMHLAPIADKAIVYIIRPSIVGFAIMMRLDCDSFQVGWIGARSYLFTILDPGQHTFFARSENETSLPMTLEAGKIYFINEEPRMGFAYARTKLDTFTEEQGRKYLRKCGLSKENRYPLFPLSKSVEREPPSGN